MQEGRFDAYRDYDKVPEPVYKKSKSKERGYIKNVDNGRMKEFLFNPDSFDLSYGAVYKEIESPGASYPRFQYVRGESKELSMDLFLYGNNGECENFLTFLDGFLPLGHSNVKFQKPPMMIFCLGIMVKKCILISYVRKHTSFRKDLGYKEVTVTIKLKVVA